jgi:YbbR domain-containing protein
VTKLLQRLIAWSTHDWALKVTSLAIAFLLWVTVRAETPGQWEAEMEVRVVNNDAEWVVAGPPTPSTVSVTLRGPLGELLRTASDLPHVIVPVDQVNDSLEFHELRRNWVSMPPGTDNTEVASFNPTGVRVMFDRVSTRLIPVVAELQGELSEGYVLAGVPQIEPAVVRASGARRDLAKIDSLRLPPIDLRDRRALDTLELTIDTTGTGLIISPRTVRVVVPIRPILQDSAGGVPFPGATLRRVP